MAGGMDLMAIAQSYVDRMVEVPGMKALLLDAETTVSLSGIATQTYIQNHEVYLVEKLEANKTDKLPHLKAGRPAICYLRPTRENVARLRRELKDPRFGAYHIFFTNRAEDLRLQDLAEADVHEVVHGVQECFCDFIVLDGDHLDVPVPRPHVLLQPAEWEYGAAMDAVQRGTEGLASLALALRRRFTIRCAAGSEAGARLGAGLQHLAGAEERELFDFGLRGGGGNPVLLLMDRSDDPVTPLLTQWTYRAMVHELLGIDDGCVDLAGAAAATGGSNSLVRPEYATAVVTPAADEFFEANAGRNYGEVGMAVKGLVDELAGAQRASGELGSIEAMSAFVEGLGGLGASQGTAYKHVTIMGELGAAVEGRGLMALSSLEQDIVCGPSALSAHAEAVGRTVGDPAHSPADWLRLAALFALRYERDGAAQIAGIVTKLRAAGIPEAKTAVLKTLLERCGTSSRVGDLFQDRTLTSRFAVLAKQHIKGVENVYTQHTPLLTHVLERLAKGRLPESEYPFVDRAAAGSGGSGVPPPRLIVVFILGGSTYEEAAAVAAMNAAAARGEGPLPPGTRVLLGGTGVLNSTAFLNSLAAVTEAKPVTGGRGLR